MKILVAYYSETGNTAKIADTIREGLSAMGHEAALVEVPDAQLSGELAPGTLNAYILVSLGSACHDADLAMPVKQILERVPISPDFKLAGLATHTSLTPDSGERGREQYETWASRCGLSFRQASKEKEFNFLGHFGCTGAPSPLIERFIHSTIVTDENEWGAYIQEAREHPDESDLRKAREVAHEVLARC